MGQGTPPPASGTLALCYKVAATKQKENIASCLHNFLETLKPSLSNATLYFLFVVAFFFFKLMLRKFSPAPSISHASSSMIFALSLSGNFSMPLGY